MVNIEEVSIETLIEIRNALWQIYINKKPTSLDAQYLESILHPILKEVENRKDGDK